MLTPVNAPGETDAATDDALVARARRGDRAAFDRLIARHLPTAWRVAWRVVRDRSDAEDVAQEAFLTAWRSLPDFRGDAAFSSWLHRIVVTRALNHLERAAERMKRASRPLVGAAAAADPAGDADPAVERAAGPREPGPLARLEARERLGRLADCFRRLPPAFRAVVALRDGEDRAYDEIASILGIELGTVRSRLARARASLKECVEGGAP
jgi:RNA polymerase sigma-70 factor (ECF subfamily)